MQNALCFPIGFQEYFRATSLMSYSHNVFDQHGCLCIETIGNRFNKIQLTFFK